MVRSQACRPGNKLSGSQFQIEFKLAMLYFVITKSILVLFQLHLSNTFQK